MRILWILIGLLLVVFIGAQLDGLVEQSNSFPDWAQAKFYKVELWQWIGIGIAVLLGLAVYTLTRALVSRVLDRVASMNPRTRKDFAVGSGALAGGLLALPLILELSITPPFGKYCVIAADGVMILGGVLISFAWWDAVCDQVAARAVGIDRAEKLLVPMTRKIIRATILLVGILFALGAALGTDKIMALIAGLGVGGIVVALAAKDSIENLFGSLTILFDMPFRIGDWVKIDKVEGVVEEINLRSTRIRTFEDTLITLPNANLIRAAVENYGLRRTRRQKLLVRLSYESDAVAIRTLCASLTTTIAAIPKVVEGSTVVELNDPTDATWGVLIQCLLDVDNFAEEMSIRNEILLAAFALKTVPGIVFPGTAKPLVGATPPAESTASEPSLSAGIATDITGVS